MWEYHDDPNYRDNTVMIHFNHARACDRRDTLCKPVALQNLRSEQQNLRMGIRGIGIGLAKVPDQGLTKTFVFDNFCDFKASLRILKMVTFLNSRI